MLLQWADSRRIGRLDAQALLADAMGCGRSRLLAWPDHEPERSACQRFMALVERRAAGEPLAYLTGTREFWSLPLRVTSATLVPRPETELLVELALQRLRPSAHCTVADLGTGNGAIALAIASERPRWRVTATDRSTAALTIARANALALGLETIEFRTGDWCAALGHDTFDLIVANPPYVAADDTHLQSAELRYEPREALTPGADGLTAIRTIVATAGDHLKPGGWLILEHGYDQGGGVWRLFAEAGYAQIEGLRDLAGQPRATVGRRPERTAQVG